MDGKVVFSHSEAIKTALDFSCQGVAFDQNTICRKIVATKMRYIVKWSYEKVIPRIDLPSSLPIQADGFFNGPTTGRENNCQSGRCF
jgi:hypothetical protein